MPATGPDRLVREKTMTRTEIDANLRLTPESREPCNDYIGWPSTSGRPRS